MKKPPAEPETELERRKRQSPRAYFLLGKVAPVMAEAQIRLGAKHPRTDQLNRMVAALFEFIDKGEDVALDTAVQLLNVIDE